MTDRPFAETREQLGGFFLVNAQDLDEAIAIATRIPRAKVGTVEIRPVIEVAGLPSHDHPQPYELKENPHTKQSQNYSLFSIKEKVEA